MTATASRSFTLPEGPGRRGRDATEQRILDATNELLQEGASLASLSVARIASAAGVSRATFYLHFPDKRQLLARLAQQRQTQFGAIAEPFLSDPNAGREVLAAVILEIVMTWRATAGMLGSLIELSEYDEAGRQLWRAAVGEVAKQVVPVLRARRPDLSAAESASLAEAAVWMAERVCHQMAGTESSRAQAERAAAALTETIWRIIAP